MEASKKLKKLYADEKKARETRKAEKRKEREAKGPFSVRLWDFIKRWVIRIFYTIFFIAFAYVLVMSCTSMIPVAMGYVVGSMGYTLNEAAEIMLASLSGLFFTAWVFVITFFVIKKAFNLYIGGIKKTLPDFAAERLDNITK